MRDRWLPTACHRAASGGLYYLQLCGERRENDPPFKYVILFLSVAIVGLLVELLLSNTVKVRRSMTHRHHGKKDNLQCRTSGKHTLLNISAIVNQHLQPLYVLTIRVTDMRATSARKYECATK